MVDLVTLSDDDDDEKISLLQSNESLFKSLIKTVEEIFSSDNASNAKDLHSILETIIDFQKSCDVHFLGSELYRDHLIECKADLSQSNAIKKLTVFVQKMLESSNPNFHSMPTLETVPIIIKRTAPTQSSHESDSDELQIIDTKPTEKHPNKRRRVGPTKTQNKTSLPSSSSVIKLKGSVPITKILARLPKVAKIASTGTIQQHVTKTASITSKINEVVQNHIQKNLSDLSSQFKSCDPAHKAFTLLLERSKEDNSDVWCSSSLAECLKVYKTITDTDFLMRKLHDLLQLKYFKQNPLIMPIPLDDEHTVVFNMKDYLRLMIFKNGCEAILPDSHKNMVNIFYNFFTKSTEKQKGLIRKRLEKLPFSDDPQFSGSKTYAATLLTCLNDMIEMLMKTFNEPESDDDDILILDTPPVINKPSLTSTATSSTIATSSTNSTIPRVELTSTPLMEVLSPDSLVEMPFPVTDPDEDNNVESQPEKAAEECILPTPVEDQILDVPVEEGILEVPVEEEVVDVPVEDVPVVNVPVEDGISEVSLEEGILEVPVEEGAEDGISNVSVDESILELPDEEGIERGLSDVSVDESILELPVEEGIERGLSDVSVDESILELPVEEGVELGIPEVSLDESILEVPVKDGILNEQIGLQSDLSVDLLGESHPKLSAEEESARVEPETGIESTEACNIISSDVVSKNTCSEIYVLEEKPVTIGISAEPANVPLQHKRGGEDNDNIVNDDGIEVIDDTMKTEDVVGRGEEMLDLYMMEALTSENMEVERSESPGEKTPEQMDTLDILEQSLEMEYEEVNFMDVGEGLEDKECEMAEVSEDVEKENKVSEDVEKEKKEDKGKRRLVLSRVVQTDTETNNTTDGTEEAKATDTTLLEDLDNYDLEEDQDIPCSQSSVQFVKEESNDCFITNVKEANINYVAVDHSSTKSKERKSSNSSTEDEDVIGASDVERNKSCEEAGDEKGKSSETILKLDVEEISKEVGEKSKDHAESSKAGDNDTSEDDIDDTTEEYQTRVTQIRKCSRKLGKLSRRIRAVQEADLDIEEMNKWNNLYAQELSLKKRHNKVLKKLKELQGEMEDVEYDFEVTVVCGIPAVETYVQNKINRKQKFPDLQDVSTLVMRAIKRNNIKMKDPTIESLSRQIFLDIGTQIQSHRKREYLLDGGSHLSDKVNTSEDPAKTSKELRSLLKKNKKEAKEKYSNIQTVFATKQFEREMRGDESSEDDEKSDEEDDKKDTQENEGEEKEGEEKEGDEVEEKKESEGEKKESEPSEKSITDSLTILID